MTTDTITRPILPSSQPGIRAALATQARLHFNDLADDANRCAAASCREDGTIWGGSVFETPWMEGDADTGAALACQHNAIIRAAFECHADAAAIEDVLHDGNEFEREAEAHGYWSTRKTRFEIEDAVIAERQAKEAARTVAGFARSFARGL